MIEKKAVTSLPINELAAWRWSCRAFDITKPVEKEKIIAICEAGRWAPSCGNDQPWRFIIFNKLYNKQDYEKAFSCLSASNQNWVANAPVLIAAAADTKFLKERTDNRWGQFDTGAACMNMYLEAVSQGLMAHPMGGFDEEKLRQSFNIPDDFIPMAMIAVGYQAEADVMPENKRDKELAPRKRHELGECFFAGVWGKAINSTDDYNSSDD
ncbi:MAG: hypothetical protein QG635_345 [Bacteroidota bacterium]|nr:hypothetical protein [Bacteroidota bacterium]